MMTFLDLNYKHKIQITITLLVNIRKTVILIWDSSKKYTLLNIVLNIILGIIPVVQIYIGKIIVDNVINAIQLQGNNESIRKVVYWILAEFVLAFLSEILTKYSAYIQKVLGDLLIKNITTHILNKAVQLDVSFYEDSAYYDQLKKAQQEAGFRPMQTFNHLFSNVKNIVSFSGLIGLLMAFHPLIIVIILICVVPVAFVEIHYSKKMYNIYNFRIPEVRKREYYKWLLVDRMTCKEIKQFRLGDYFLNLFHHFYNKHIAQDKLIGFKRNMISAILNIFSSIGFYGLYVFFALKAISNVITLGSMVMYINAIRQIQEMIKSILLSISSLYENNLYLSNLYSFLDKRPEIFINDSLQPVPEHIKIGIEFRNVSFKYPGTEKQVLQNINIKLKPKENVALVGQNGSGKTTLIKLLCRFYDPDIGQILIDGKDIREYNLETLRRRIGIIFQDYFKYELTVKENIGIGNIEEINNIEKIKQSAEKSDADKFITSLANGYNHQLGRIFNDGVELSGGQWQKIALSRAFIRDAAILALDEPTSSLDAETEYEVFKKFSELTRNKVSLLISHRFSTIRMAQTIYVLNNGTIVENGSHQELLNQNGYYAKLFRIQAEQYQWIH
jgi:ABC-type multidrug transport system fused ATPase/permease subunit